MKASCPNCGAVWNYNPDTGTCSACAVMARHAKGYPAKTLWIYVTQARLNCAFAEVSEALQECRKGNLLDPCLDLAAALDLIRKAHKGLRSAATKEEGV